MAVNRHAFLRHVAGSGLVLGLPLAGCRSWGGGELLRDARGRMRGENKVGVVFRIPDDEGLARGMGRDLVELFDAGISPEGRCCRDRAFSGLRDSHGRAPLCRTCRTLAEI